MIVEYKKDKEYTFDVVEVNTKKGFSVLSDGSKTHYYPRIIKDESITLKIQSIDNDKLRFYFHDLNDWLEYVGKEIIARVIRKEKIEVVGKKTRYFLICSYLDSEIWVKSFNWQMLDEFKDSKLTVCVSKNKGRIFFNQKPEELIHPIYTLKDIYSFRFKGFSEETHIVNNHSEDLRYYIHLECVKTQLVYQLPRKYGFHRLGKDEVVEFKYYGVNKDGIPLLVQLDYYFIKKDHIFNTKKELSLISQDYFVNSILLEQYNSQYKDDDNKWVLTLSSYLSQTVKSKLERSDFNDLKELIEAHRKLITFIRKTKFFLAWKGDIQLKTKRAIERSERINQKIDIIYNYIDEYGVEDILINKKVEFDIQLNVFCDLIKYFSFSIISKPETVFILDQLIKAHELTNDQYTKLFLTFSNYYQEHGNRYDSNFYLDKSRRKSSLEKIVDNQDIQILKRVLLIYNIFDIKHVAIQKLYITTFNFYILFKGILESNQSYITSGLELFFNNKIRLKKRESFSVDKFLDKKEAYNKLKSDQVFKISYRNIVDHRFCYIAFDKGNYFLLNRRYNHFIINQIKTKQDLSLKVKQTLFNISIVDPIINLNNSMELKLDTFFKGIVKSRDSYNNYYVSLIFDDSSNTKKYDFIDGKLEVKYNKSLLMFNIDIGESIDVYIHKFNKNNQPCLRLKDPLTSNHSCEMDTAYPLVYYDFNQLFRYLSELFVSSTSLKDQEKYLVFIKYIGGLIRAPRMYLLQILWEFYNVIEGLSKDLDITSELKTLSNNDNFVKLKNSFPNITNLEKIVEIISLRNTDLVDMVKNLNNNTGIYQRIQKLILVQRLLSDESESVRNSLNKNILELIKEGTTSIFLAQNNQKENIIDTQEVDIDYEIMRKIEEGTLYEDNQCEFKATLKCPVHSKDELKKINYLESQLLKKEGNIDLLDELTKTQNINIKDKASHNKLLMSVFKNICGMLNTNNGGQIIIGVRENEHEEIELKGLDSDYKLESNYDGLQLYFNNKFKEVFKDPTLYFPYVIPRKVIYKNMEFMIIEIERITDFDNACFLNFSHNLVENSHKLEQRETCYIRNHGESSEISGEALHTFKRTIKKIKHIDDPCSVYLMQDEDDNIKIGKAKNPEKRRKELSQGRTKAAKSYKIKLLFHQEFPSRFIANKIEGALQRKYQKFNINKSEWFKFPDVTSYYEDAKGFISDQDIIYNK